MALETNAVNFNATGFKRGDKVLCCSCFGAGVFNVVIVVIELYSGVILSGRLISDGNIFGADLGGFDE